MEAKWTTNGVTAEVTNRRGDCLEQGGVCDRVEHYSLADIESLGYHHDDDLDSRADGEYATRLEMIRHHLTPRVLRRGVIIQ